MSYDSHDFFEWQIALKWGCDLETWYHKDQYARLAMIATYIAANNIEAAEMTEHEREAKLKRGNPSR